ncbi:MAG: Hsp33 family molecular chaperone HslO [Clostridia bacterium]|nr:Hsp33 family molecular chaperone HslO [Clostridia bacterium]
MNEILKGVLFNKTARITIINITDLVNKVIDIHKLSNLSAVALGRALVCGTYIGTNLKSADDSYSIIIDGKGPLGNICISGNNKTIRGYVSNPQLELPFNNKGTFDVSTAVGTDGCFTIIKDLGLKEKYNGKTNLVNGEIGTDFSNYLLQSEGIKNGVLIGVNMEGNKCIGAGGIIIEALPKILDEELFIIEDILGNIPSISELISRESITSIYDFYFSHLNAEKLGVDTVDFKCNCSREKIDGVLRGLGKAQFYDTIEKEGKLEVLCSFCNTTYTYTKEDEKRIW